MRRFSTLLTCHPPNFFLRPLWAGETLEFFLEVLFHIFIAMSSPFVFLLLLLLLPTFFVIDSRSLLHLLLKAVLLLILNFLRVGVERYL